MRYPDMRRAVARSIAGLEDSQFIQVGLWGPAVPSSTGSLIAASMSGKQKVIGSLERFRPTGTGADGGLRRLLERHLRVSYASSRGRAIKTVCLLVGADLHNPKDVQAALDKYPWRTSVQVLTVQYGKLSPKTEKLLERVAATRGGRFTKLP